MMPSGVVTRAMIHSGALLIGSFTHIDVPSKTAGNSYPVITHILLDDRIYRRRHVSLGVFEDLSEFQRSHLATSRNTSILHLR